MIIKPICYIIHTAFQNAGCLLNTTFVFDRLAVGASVNMNVIKKHCLGTFPKADIFSAEILTKGALVTPTQTYFT